MDSRASDVIHVRAKARIAEFLGYVQASSASPLIRTNTTEGNRLVWDGQTLALGFGTVTNTLLWSSKVRVLGDIPWLGRLFRSEETNSVRRQQIVIITPTRIDLADNRINSAENPPFDASTTPAHD